MLVRRLQLTFANLEVKFKSCETKANRASTISGVLFLQLADVAEVARQILVVPVKAPSQM